MPRTRPSYHLEEAKEVFVPWPEPPALDSTVADLYAELSLKKAQPHGQRIAALLVALIHEMEQQAKKELYAKMKVKPDEEEEVY